MEKIILLDSNSLINRAYYAIGYLSTKDGQYTNAIYGYISMLARLINDEKPTHICAVFDEREKTFRSELYSEYKANRKGMPVELAAQLNPLKDILRAMGISVLSKSGFEADDIIGTLSKRFDADTVIVTGDRDSLQLIDGKTRVFYTKQGVSNIIKYDEKTLAGEGFTPQKIIEYKALAGDKSDNIPGAKGVGEKTALELLSKYENIEGIYSNLEKIEKPALKARLAESMENVFLSKRLATIDSAVDIQCGLDDLIFRYPVPKRAEKLLLALELKTLANRFKYYDDLAEDEPETEFANEQADAYKDFGNISSVEIAESETLKNFISGIPYGSNVAVYYSGSGINVSHGDTEAKIQIVEGLFGVGLSAGDAEELLAPLYSKEYINIVYDAKTQMHFLSNSGICLMRPYEDIQLKAHLVNPNRRLDGVEGLIEEFGLDKNFPAASILRLNEILDKRLEELELTGLYRGLELPLIECLYDMEREGFCIDTVRLAELSLLYDGILFGLTENIHNLAGEKFNINSNKQLSGILFDKLNLPYAKKNKTGFSVSAEVLEELDHPIAYELLKYRQYSKLKSTYIDGLRSVMNKMTGRVHTSFKQCLTVTGRLSSVDPNLQNIPVRTSEGREIRKIFIASPGRKLVCADYSQIELRLMAHFSKDEQLITAYKNSDDIHALTAAKIYNLPLSEVTSEMRRSAKAVNFGIIYGISGFGLSQSLDITPYKASQYITEYFKTYPGVKDFMDENVRIAKEKQMLRSLMGRIRFFPELKSSKYQMRAFAERAAMNMPLQGSAADIIKAAMLKVYVALKDGNYKSRMILQVHDELILDCPENEVEDVKSLLKECMESAVTLAVPLIANVSDGKNWFEAK